MNGKKHVSTGIPLGEQDPNITGKVPPRKVGKKPTRPKKRSRLNRK